MGMRRLVWRGFGALCLCAWFGAASAGDSALMPLPTSDMKLPGSFTVSAATPVQGSDPAAEQFILLLAEAGGPHLQHGDGEHVIRFVTDKSVKGPEGSYRLNISPSGVIVSAADSKGLFYGGISLWQLLCDSPTLAAAAIEDQPRFAWRGLMLDSARHFQSVAYIKRFIDWMAINKLNLFHWHLTDDQGWRIEIKHFPKLTSFGPYYTQEQIKDVVAYAAARQITILPEIDMPGHAAAAVAAYPELGVAPVTITKPSTDWGAINVQFNVEESTFTFLETVLDEVMALFPGQYVHAGGDEVAKERWQQSPEIQARMRQLGIKDEEGLQSYFIHRIDDYLTSKGHRLIGWDEILQGGIAPHATVMSWRGLDGALAAAKAGHDTVLSPHPLLYLDNRQATYPWEAPGRGRVVTVEDIYKFNPLPTELTAEEGKHVLGVQANIWTEHMRTEQFVTRMTYPRAVALAEIAWTAADRLDYADFTRRLGLQQKRYAKLGLKDDTMYAGFDPGTKIYSQQLTTCSDKLVISLEDDAPKNGPRAIFLTDVENPCWILPKARLTSGRLTANVGSIPFNFQIGAERDAIHMMPPRSQDGELLVNDGCSGPLLASLSLTPAKGNQGVTSLIGKLPKLAGEHDLCFRFTGKDVDPLWMINWIDLQ
jgi:hexosaminidase